MSLIACPACGKQVSQQAPACPHCGHPIAPALVAMPLSPPPQKIVLQPVQHSGGSCGCVVFLLLGLIAMAILAFTNPPEADMRLKIVQDGWAPVTFERTNLIVCNWVNVTGFTGSKATYLGIGGTIFKLR